MGVETHKKVYVYIEEVSQMPFGLMVLWGKNTLNRKVPLPRVVSNAFRLNGSVGEGLPPCGCDDHRAESQMPFGLMVLWGILVCSRYNTRDHIVSNAFRLNGSVGVVSSLPAVATTRKVSNAFRLNGSVGDLMTTGL